MLIDMNYKEIDTQRIIDYIGTFANGVSVDRVPGLPQPEIPCGLSAQPGVLSLL